MHSHPCCETHSQFLFNLFTQLQKLLVDGLNKNKQDMFSTELSAKEKNSQVDTAEKLLTKELRVYC